MLTDSDVAYQVEKLDSYMRRGGDLRQWFDSKDFARKDQRRIKRALLRMRSLKLAQAAETR